MSDLSDYIRNVPDFPKQGIGFKDITTLLKDRSAFRASILELAEFVQPWKTEKIVGIESRGFILGAALAFELGAGFVPIRKPGKLPAETVSEEYQLEYGADRIELHKDAISEGENIALVDDLLATGGTAEAAIKLVNKLGGNIQGIAFLIELTFLGGRARLGDHEIISLIQYESE